MYCFDSEPGELRGNAMKRDAFLPADDRFMWTLDTFLNQQSGYFFEMNPGLTRVVDVTTFRMQLHS